MDLFSVANEPLPQAMPIQAAHNGISQYNDNDKSKVKTLFKFASGVYETAKKSNHSNAIIPQDVIDELEAGNITSERIEELKRSFPIYKYQTCLTVHGNWGVVNRDRIGNYKNVIQNENGSLEILWTAVDHRKKTTIAHALNISGSKFEYRENSSETYFRWYQSIKDEQQWNEVLPQMRAAAERVNAIQGLHTKTVICRYRSWYGDALEIAVYALAIPEDLVEPLALALSGHETRQKLDAAIAVEEQRKAIEKAKRDADSELRKEELKKKQEPMIEQLKKDMVLIKEHVEQFQPVIHQEPVPGHTYVIATYNQSEIRAFMKVLTVEKGSFGRLKLEIKNHYVSDGQIDPDGTQRNFGHYTTKKAKEFKVDEIKTTHKFPGNWRLVK